MTDLLIVTGLGLALLALYVEEEPDLPKIGILYPKIVVMHPDGAINAKIITRDTTAKQYQQYDMIADIVSSSLDKCVNYAKSKHGKAYQFSKSKQTCMVFANPPPRSKWAPSQTWLSNEI